LTLTIFSKTCPRKDKDEKLKKLTPLTMQTELNFQSREIQKPVEFLTLQRAQTILTILAVATAFFAIVELSLS